MMHAVIFEYDKLQLTYEVALCLHFRHRHSNCKHGIPLESKRTYINFYVFTTKFPLSKPKIYDSSPTFEILGVLFVNEVGQVSSVVEDHVEGLSIGKDDRLKMPSFYYSFKEKKRADFFAQTCSMHHMYSSSVSPFQAYTGTPRFAIAAAA